MAKIITTSWDDGHPKDFMINELLDKYNLKGSFYIPRTNPENAVMSEAEVLSLSQNNEIGGHTLNHVRLTGISGITLEAEVLGCFQWLRNLLGKDPVSFCFPLGSYNAHVVKAVELAGFQYARTTELLSVLPAAKNYSIATTIQVYDHKGTTYFRHLLKRFKVHNMLLWMKSGPDADILKLTDYYIDHIERHGGCFHLWGHSWEIEEYNLWNKLELVFRHISRLQGFTYAWNKDLMAHQ